MAARKFSLRLNLKDAHDLGIDVPLTVDEVIE
jgi:hypothetical protein